MKKKLLLCICFFVLLSVGCSHSSAPENAADHAVSETDTITISTSSDTIAVQEEQTYNQLEDTASDTSQSSQTIAASEDSDVDYDLTTMDSDMVYATVFQITSHPEDYVGKTFQIEGIFSSSYADTLDRYFYYCIIKDALACCAQGLEFILSDSEELSPEDYPAEGTEIIVRGTLEAYTEPGFSVSYGRLVDASYTLVSSEP